MKHDDDDIVTLEVALRVKVNHRNVFLNVRDGYWTILEFLLRSNQWTVPVLHGCTHQDIASLQKSFQVFLIDRRKKLFLICAVFFWEECQARSQCLTLMIPGLKNVYKQRSFGVMMADNVILFHNSINFGAEIPISFNIHLKAQERAWRRKRKSHKNHWRWKEDTEMCTLCASVLPASDSKRGNREEEMTVNKKEWENNHHKAS